MPGVYTNGQTLATPANWVSSYAPQVPADTEAASGQNLQSLAVPYNLTGLGLAQTYTAAGSTQGGATPITTLAALITVALTASTKGVRLPAAVTGLAVRIANAATFGVKVYPATGQQIAAAATNAADSTVLAVNKGNVYQAVSATKWIVFRGA